ncbi:hypothetical protein ACFVSW_06040 [Neobacillus sp. NPDC058068]|uniref:hypothetical protein n=1 Tax=Neobacillus sp. NPDC058068 TaxID=3346325 RepID=UPI0036DD026B
MGGMGYEVYRSSSANGSYKLVQTITNSSTLSFTNTSLATGTNYYYKIRAYRLVNGKRVYGSFSSIVSGKPTLAQVTSVKANSQGYDKILVKWSKLNGASGSSVSFNNKEWSLRQSNNDSEWQHGKLYK